MSVNAGPGFAFEPLDRIFDRHAFGRLALDLEDVVAGLQAGPIGGCPDQRAENLELLVIDRDLDADAAELALDRALEATQVVAD